MTRWRHLSARTAPVQGQKRDFYHGLLEGQIDIVFSLAFSHDGNTLAVASGEIAAPGLGRGQVKLWDMTPLKRKTRMQN